MPLTRIVRPGLAAVLLGVGLAGCGQPQPNKPDGKPGDPKAGPAPASPTDLKAAQTAAADFLKAVREGKGSAAALTAEFKKAYAPPERPDEMAVGYSDTAAAFNLKHAATEVGDDVSTPAGSGDTAFAVAKGKAGGRTLLRLVKAGSDWKVDWLSVAPKGVSDATLSGEAAPAQFAAQAFVDAVLTRKFPLAAGLLSDAAKATYGKSVFDGKFDPGALKNKLEEFFGGADRYTVTASAKDGVTVELPLAGGKKTATLKLTAGRSATDMKVDQIEVK